MPEYIYIHSRGGKSRLISAAAHIYRGLLDRMTDSLYCFIEREPFSDFSDSASLFFFGALAPLIRFDRGEKRWASSIGFQR